jgi:hypothetical protein
VKYRIGAAIAAIALTLLPGALFAGSASEIVSVRHFDADTHTVTGVSSSSEVHRLRHTAATVHDFVVDPELFPPGPTRSLVNEWNLAVFQNKSASKFVRLLRRAVELGIPLQVERTDKANADGTFDLVKVAPGR